MFDHNVLKCLLQFLKKGVSKLQSLYEGSVKLGRLSPEQAKKRLDLLKPTTDYQLAKNVDIVSVLCVKTAVIAGYSKLDQKVHIYDILD